MLIPSLTLAGTIARQPARLTANRLRRRERIKKERSDQGKAEGLSALYIKKYCLIILWYYFMPAPLYQRRRKALR